MSIVDSKQRRKRGKAREAARSKVRPKSAPVLSTGSAIGLALMWISALALVHWNQGFTPTGLVPDQKAPVSVVAEVDFDVVDFAQTELAREQAATATLPVFQIDPAGLQYALRHKNMLFDKLTTGADTNSVPDLEAARILLEAWEISLSPIELKDLAAPSQINVLNTALTRTLTAVWNEGIRPASETIEGFKSIELHGEASRPPRRIKAGTLPDADAAARLAAEQIRKVLPASPWSTEVLVRLIRPWVKTNLIYDKAASDAIRESAITAVSEQTVVIRAGSTLMEAGERVSPQMLELLRVHQERLNDLKTVADRLYELAGNALLLLVALLVYTGLLFLSHSERLRDPRRILLSLSLSVLVLLLTQGLVHLAFIELIRPELLIALVPIALAALLAVILVDAPFALATSLWTSFTVSMLFADRFVALVLGLALTMVAVLAARNLYRRSRILRVGLFIGVTHAAFMVAVGFLHRQPWDIVCTQAGAAVGGGIVLAFLVLLLVPVFEMLFRFTTDLHLLELLDTTHPLLEKLAIEAPGTYHHSLMVSNLAQAAAQEVGANSLLVRVCAYYHDIGKITKPEFFIENNPYAENPHDELSPSMSTLIIVSHVKEGASMAARHKLPKPIIDSILQHHGTSVISYFHHRAVAQAKADGLENGDLPKRDEFRYPGPKPNTLEMGILMLADTVEAASRAMEKPSPSGINTLIDELFATKLADGQLDDCPMTFQQLAAIKRVFMFNLNNMLHGRIAYPKDEDDAAQPPASPAREPKRTEKPGADAHAAGKTP